MGGGVILLAFMTPVFTPEVLIPLHGIIQLISNTFRVVLSYKKVDIKITLYFTCGAVLGSLLGFPLTLKLPLIFFTSIIAVSILVFTWFPFNNKAVQFKGKFFIVGGVASFLSLFIGAVGPLTAPFFINSQLNKHNFISTKAACQIPVHLLKVIIYLVSGFVISQWLREILISVPFVFAGTYIGKLLAGKINEYYYKFIVKLVITILAVTLMKQR